MVVVNWSGVGACGDIEMPVDGFMANSYNSKFPAGLSQLIFTLVVVKSAVLRDVWTTGLGTEREVDHVLRASMKQ